MARIINYLITLLCNKIKGYGEISLANFVSTNYRTEVPRFNRHISRLWLLDKITKHMKLINQYNMINLIKSLNLLN